MKLILIFIFFFTFKALAHGIIIISDVENDDESIYVKIYIDKNSFLKEI